MRYSGVHYRWLVFLIVSIFLACSENGVPPETPEAPHPATSVVVSHTSGTISRGDQVQVRFDRDMASADKLNTPLSEAPLSFDPPIAGTASWTQRRTLVFTPEKSLPPDQNITATVHLKTIMENMRGIETFVFHFKTMKQAMELSIEGMQPAGPGSPSEQRLNGTVTTADAERDDRMKSVLKAFQDERELSITWRHSENGRRHDFIVAGIARKETDTRVTLTWDGKAIGSDQRGQRVVTVPSKDTFEVSFARAVQGPERYVEVRFSDPLKKDQRLEGLIRVKDRQELKFRISGNIVRIYDRQAWAGESEVLVSAGIRNRQGLPMQKASRHKVFFDNVKPQVRFAGKGVILPTSLEQTIPVETMNLRAVRVTATEIFSDNIPQYLQVNALDGQREVERVGRIVWKKTVLLNWSPEHRNRWVRHGLDVAPLIADRPGGIYRLTLSFARAHIVYPCGDTPQNTTAENGSGTEGLIEESNWDSAELYQDYDWETYYQNRENPCHKAFYHRYFGGRHIKVSRNLLLSDIGVLAKKGSDGNVFVAVTDLKSALPLAGASIRLLDYQLQVIAEGTSAEDGTTMLQAERKPFLLVAANGDQTGYLRMDDGSSLSVSHFDVSGQNVKGGIKGFIYGERGVWRPGDPIYLTFIRLDSGNSLPPDHPVHFELINPRGQRVRQITTKKSVNGFYRFHVSTDADAPTGNWIARVSLGGVLFEKKVKVETVRPNRLKIELDFGGETKSLRSGSLKAGLSAAWLHGATAANLKTDVELSFQARKTQFPGYEDYRFDDPVRKYSPESAMLFEGRLDGSGKTVVDTDIQTRNLSPGMLTANFKTRVFEPGGAFSSDYFRMPFHPYDRYVGVSVPKGDAARGMLLTDTDHTIRLAAVDHRGKALPDGNIEVALYKIKWRWWWEKGAESLADYVGTDAYMPIEKDTVRIQNGSGQWNFRVDHPQWGRYLIRAHLQGSDHYSGAIVYVDWPGWAGRAQKESPGGATVLSFSADKPTYKVGETVSLAIPTGKNGRGLVSIETGSRVLQTDWIEGGPDTVQYRFTATPEMAPGIYAHVTFLQPHHQTANDLPIRMYGVIPVAVHDPQTKLKPVIESAEVFKPEESAAVTVREATGRSMTYTLAVVDEGLLGLTRYQVPDPWAHFYKREALGVKTWDVFDDVIGAYGGALEQLLSIGGDEEAIAAGQQKANRFPPMVRFLGPFELPDGASKTHQIDMPLYVGAVRVMVVAGQGRSFGASQKSVFVRKPLMVLGSLPRVLGPGEAVNLPVAVFAMEESVRRAEVLVTTEGPLSLAGPARKKAVFNRPGEKMVTFRLIGGDRPGKGRVRIEAADGSRRATHIIELDVRHPGHEVTDVLSHTVPPGQRWQQEVPFPGNAGTNHVVLEVSRIPPLNLENRLDFLVRYPYGCAEQTVSAVFPQLYLDELMELPREQQRKIQKNIEAGLRRLRKFQRSDGGFGLWPGAAQADPWITTYAGHFLLEASRAGYLVPADIMEAWQSHQRERARQWVAGPVQSELMQAYRLYSLALSGKAALGAMNRLAEENDLPAAASWRLAAAYHLAGQPEAGRQLTNGLSKEVDAYRELAGSYGSGTRDQAMILEALCIMGRMSEGQELMRHISAELAGEKWLSTQTTAFALIAVARLAGLLSDETQTTFAVSWNGSQAETVASPMPLVQRPLESGTQRSGYLDLENRSTGVLYARIFARGLPDVGGETAAQNGFALSVGYFDLDGERLDPSRLTQGTDMVARIRVKNTAANAFYQEVALTHPVASGFEIRNTRLDGEGESAPADIDYQDVRDDRVYTYFDLKRGESKEFVLLMNASFIGRFYLPMVSVETMYDASINARIPGRWISVAAAGESGGN